EFRGHHQLHATFDRYPSESATLTRSNSSISRLKSQGSQRTRLTRPVITVDG
ncbi:unnamed protein product, partial [Musa acuminata subsp. burmannicoides]